MIYSASYTPTENTLHFMDMQVRLRPGEPLPICTGDGLTWTLTSHVVIDSWWQRLVNRVLHRGHRTHLTYQANSQKQSRTPKGETTAHNLREVRKLQAGYSE